MSRVPTIRVLNMVAYAEEVVSKILAHCSVMKPRCASRGITLITVITVMMVMTVEDGEFVFATLLLSLFQVYAHID